MRVNRLFVEQSLVPGRPLTLNPAATRYLTQVLRLRAGDAVRVFNGDGREFHAALSQVTRSGAVLAVGELAHEEPPARLRPHLWLGISRGERMDFALQKAVELGVASILPLHTRRSMVKLDGERERKRLAHWRGVIVSACEQSGRCRLAELQPPAALEERIAEPRGLALLLDPEATESLPQLTPSTADLTLLIGPEGGLTPEERALARASGFVGVRLGPRILRTETAPLAALAALQVLWGDYR